ncbi:prepilin-type N-terminal cleavage/methylation domain-containing protein [Vibrio sp.]|nr:prepilin-type N-terminal cleavage/methylation domain-containing protein [Vibrio sp.]
MQTDRQAQQGFSLIEVMLSFIIIGVGALGLIKLQTFVEQRADYAEHSMEALNLAEQKLEWFRTRGASSALSTISAADFTTDIVSGNTVSGEYTVDWTVPAATVSGSLKTITIDVSWTDRFQATQTVTLQTMISQYSEFE